MSAKSPDEIILTLAKLGMDPDSIASVVDSPVAQVNATLITHRRAPANADDELRTEARAFVRRALAEAQIILDFGLPSQKMQLIRTVLPAAMRALGAGEEGDSEDTHAQLQVLFHDIRSVESATKTVSEEKNVIDVPSQQSTQQFDDAES